MYVGQVDWQMVVGWLVLSMYKPIWRQLYKTGLRYEHDRPIEIKIQKSRCKGSDKKIEWGREMEVREEKANEM